MSDKKKTQENDEMENKIPQLNKDGTITMIDRPDVSRVKRGKVWRFWKYVNRKM